MSLHKYNKNIAILLSTAMVLGVATPALAAEPQKDAVAEKEAKAAEEGEEAEEVVEITPMKLEEIQKEVLKNNRLKTTLQFNYSKVLSGLSAIDDGLQDLRDTEKSAARARKSASQSASEGNAVINQVIGSNPNSPLSEQVLGTISSGLLSGSSKIASSMEDMTSSIVEQKRDELEDQQQDLKNTKQDLSKTQEDWNNQALLVTQLLVAKTAQVETGVGLLGEKQELMERLYTIESKKQELGFSISTDLTAAKLSITETEKDIQDAKDGLVLLKRQLNDLMGRPLDDALSVEAPEMTRIIAYAPEYSEELLTTAIANNYQMKTLRRDYQQAKKKSEDSSLYSGQGVAYKMDMKIAEVSMETQKATIANDLKKKLDSINAAASAYQIQRDTYAKGKVQVEQLQKSVAVGMTATVELQAAELQLKQTALELLSVAYDYDLAWAEYQLLIEGTSLDIYDTYKAQLA